MSFLPWVALVATEPEAVPQEPEGFGARVLVLVEGEAVAFAASLGGAVTGVVAAGAWQPKHVEQAGAVAWPPNSGGARPTARPAQHIRHLLARRRAERWWGLL